MLSPNKSGKDAAKKVKKNPKKATVIDSPCDNCHETASCTFVIQLREPGDTKSGRSLSFCTSKCAEQQKVKHKEKYTTNKLDANHVTMEDLTSNKYEQINSSEAVQRFYETLLCVFHSKLFKTCASGLAFLKTGLQQQKHLSSETEPPTGSIEFTFDEFFTVAANLVAI